MKCDIFFLCDWAAIDGESVLTAHRIGEREFECHGSTARAELWFAARLVAGDDELDGDPSCIVSIVDQHGKLMTETTYHPKFMRSSDGADAWKFLVGRMSDFTFPRFSTYRVAITIDGEQAVAHDFTLVKAEKPRTQIRPPGSS